MKELCHTCAATGFWAQAGGDANIIWACLGGKWDCTHSLQVRQFCSNLQSLHAWPCMFKNCNLLFVSGNIKYAAAFRHLKCSTQLSGTIKSLCESLLEGWLVEGLSLRINFAPLPKDAPYREIQVPYEWLLFLNNKAKHTFCATLQIIWASITMTGCVSCSSFSITNGTRSETFCSFDPLKANWPMSILPSPLKPSSDFPLPSIMSWKTYKMISQVSDVPQAFRLNIIQVAEPFFCC